MRIVCSFFSRGKYRVSQPKSIWSKIWRPWLRMTTQGLLKITWMGNFLSNFEYTDPIHTLMKYWKCANESQGKNVDVNAHFWWLNLFSFINSLSILANFFAEESHWCDYYFVWRRNNLIDSIQISIFRQETFTSRHFIEVLGRAYNFNRATRD